mgnify:CR=1 FL=1
MLRIYFYMLSCFFLFNSNLFADSIVEDSIICIPLGIILPEIFERIIFSVTGSWYEEKHKLRK